MEIYIPRLPCKRVPAQCSNTEPHDAHDYKPPHVRHDGWHCYGESITPSGERVGWAGGTEEPTDLIDRCQNYPQETP
jgi:hypothetical protein